MQKGKLSKCLDLPQSLCSELTKFTKLIKSPIPIFRTAGRIAAICIENVINVGSITL